MMYHAEEMPISAQSAARNVIRCSTRFLQTLLPETNGLIQWFDVKQLNDGERTIIEQMWKFLDHADLSRANLSDAYLIGANLRDAYLRGANLRDANLSNADLSGADLRDVNLIGANLDAAKYDRSTYLPKLTMLQKLGMIKR
jgi:hypothetical protein